MHRSHRPAASKKCSTTGFTLERRRIASRECRFEASSKIVKLPEKNEGFRHW